MGLIYLNQFLLSKSELDPYSCNEQEFYEVLVWGLVHLYHYFGEI
jgi:hypothetical protein